MSLPEALVITAGCDPLVDEGVAFADKLEEAGNPAEYLCFATPIHGFANQTALRSEPNVLRALIAGFVRRQAKLGDAKAH